MRFSMALSALYVADIVFKLRFWQMTLSIIWLLHSDVCTFLCHFCDLTNYKANNFFSLLAMEFRCKSGTKFSYGSFYIQYCFTDFEEN